MTSRHQEQSNSDVNAVLQALRGESFRAQRNLQRTFQGTPILPSLTPVAHGPSLPPLFTSESDYEGQTQDTQHLSPPAATKAAGPPAPRSWGPSRLPPPLRSSSEWRSHALSLIFRYSPSHSPALAPHPTSRVPSLFQLCLHDLLFKWGGIPSELFPSIPRHILREYVRYSAVYAPTLPKEDLEAIWAIDNAGSADGELLITGPFASSVLPRLSGSSKLTPSEWDFVTDGAEPEPPPVMHTFIVLSSSFTPSLVPLLPPTLTHLALLGIPKIPIHIFPTQLPLVMVLDLSFNPWIGEGAGKLAHVEWRKWAKLEVLGMRCCALDDRDARTLQVAVNRGRLTDVEIVLNP